MNFIDAAARLQTIACRTPLHYHKRLSEKYSCEVWLKREDLQPVRSYKIRGAFNKIGSLPADALKKGVVCASAGNHAQGVAYSCCHLAIQGYVFMPANTPSQKTKRVIALGGEYVTVFLIGDTYDDAAKCAADYAQKNDMTLIPPFDDEKVIEGQATIAGEILEDMLMVDYLFMPVGGGGLAAGLCLYFKQYSANTILIGAEPAGAASMSAAFEYGKSVSLDKIDPFVDGAAVKKVGELTYQFCKDRLDHIQAIPEGKVCSTLLSLYNEDGIVTEPAGVLSVACLDNFTEDIRGKKVVCILSGSNNDSNRMDEIKKLADAWEGLQHYLVIRFHHNPDGLKDFFITVLGPDDYVNRIEYVRRDHGRSTYALLGIRSTNEAAYQLLLQRLMDTHTEYREVTKDEFLFKYWV